MVAADQGRQHQGGVASGRVPNTAPAGIVHRRSGRSTQEFVGIKTVKTLQRVLGIQELGLQARLLRVFQSRHGDPYAPSRRAATLRPGRPGSVLVRSELSRARQFAIAVEPGEKLVKARYVAEAFAVSVEDDYLVIELIGS